MSPERAAATPFEFRAPPPSPIGTSRRSSVTNDEVLTEFLEHSLRVPDLVLPETIFPRERFVENPPRIDFRLIESYDRDSVLKILDSMRSFGFFQLVNHGIPVELIGAVAAAADAGVFGISPEKKVAVGRSPEKAYGFEELWHGEDESEVSEEFVWNRDEDLKMEMEAISPIGYSNFRLFFFSYYPNIINLILNIWVSSSYYLFIYLIEIRIYELSVNYHLKFSLKESHLKFYNLILVLDVSIY